MNDMRKELSRKIPTLLEELEELEDEDDDDDDDVGLPTDEVMSRKQVLDDSDASSGEAEGVEEDDILKAVKAKAVEIESINIDQKAKSWESVSKKQRGSNAIRKRKQCKEPEVNVDPLAFKSVEKTLSCGSGAIDLVIENEEDFSAGEKRKRLTIAEAFEDDNVIEEFIQEKRNTVDQDKPKDIDLTLEGWGTWTGIGIQTSKRKRRRCARCPVYFTCLYCYVISRVLLGFLSFSVFYGIYFYLFSSSLASKRYFTLCTV